MELELFDNLPDINETDINKDEPIVVVDPKEILGDEGAPDTDQKDSDKSEEQDPVAVGYYKTLVSKGFLEESEDFKGTFDSLGEFIEKSAVDIASKNEAVVQQVAESIWLNAPDNMKKILEFSFLKPDASLEELKEFFNDFVTSEEQPFVKEVKDTEEAKTYLESFYSKIMPGKYAVKAAIEAIEDEKGENALVEEANARIKAYNDELKSKTSDKVQSRLESERKAKADKEAADREFVNSVYTELKNTNWQDKRKTLLVDYISSGKANQVIKEASTKPKAFTQLANLATYFDPIKGEFDLSSFIKQYATEDVKKVKDNIIKDNFNSAGISKGSPGEGPEKTKLEFIL